MASCRVIIISTAPNKTRLKTGWGWGSRNHLHVSARKTTIKSDFAIWADQNALGPSPPLKQKYQPRRWFYPENSLRMRQSSDLIRSISSRKACAGWVNDPPLIEHFDHFVTSLKALFSSASARLHLSAFVAPWSSSETSGENQHPPNEEQIWFRVSAEEILRPEATRGKTQNGRYVFFLLRFIIIISIL